MTSYSNSPYLLDEPPTSTGKALLARAFSHWCVLHHGLTPEEIAAALDGEIGDDPRAPAKVRHAARLIGELIAAGDLRTFARPFGGGSPERLPASDWELDDFRPRFARSALNPKAPFAHDADPTHWIFVELEDFNRIVEASCADVVPTRQPVGGPTQQTTTPRGAPPAFTEDRHVRMPELERRTGMSRSTIYRRIEQDRFPKQIPMDGNIASWWESDVADWLANPR
jgi:predicted DNA-binding transcriptional regulator AlpA